MKSLERAKRLKRIYKDIFIESRLDLNDELNNYGIKLIKIIGAIGVILGFLLLIIFYVWLFKKFF